MNQMPRDVARRIMKRAAESNDAIVVTVRGVSPAGSSATTNTEK